GLGASCATLTRPGEGGRVSGAGFRASCSPGFGLVLLWGKPIAAAPLMLRVRGAGRPLVVQRADRPSLLDDAFWSRSEVQALAAVPVRWQDRVIAALMVGFADPERLTAPELELLEEIGRQVALGMERLRLQARVQEQQNEMAVVAERNR